MEVELQESSHLKEEEMVEWEVEAEAEVEAITKASGVELEVGWEAEVEVEEEETVVWEVEVEAEAEVEPLESIKSTLVISIAMLTTLCFYRLLSSTIHLSLKPRLFVTQSQEFLKDTDSSNSTVKKKVRKP
jgi:hypothetical protein